jgi:hypothetical protein
VSWITAILRVVALQGKDLADTTDDGFRTMTGVNKLRVHVECVCVYGGVCVVVCVGVCTVHVRWGMCL